jgi:adenylate kinase
MAHEFDTDKLAAIKNWLGTGSINIFGMPFAGKDTQGRILSELFDCPLLGGGDILRGSVIPERSQEALRKGLLIPTEDYIDIVLPYLSQEEFKNHPLILSSVGRWHGEEPGVISATEQAGHPLKAVIHLEITEKGVFERWRASQEERSKGDRGDRSDDTPEIIEVRLQEFRDKTEPVLDFYRQTDMFHEISTERPPVEVTADILNYLYERATS